MSKHYGAKITPVLKEISDSLWEIDSREQQQAYEYCDSALNSAVKIMMNVGLDRMWSDFEALETDKESRLNLVEDFGAELRMLIIKHIGVDMHEEIKKELV